MKKLVGLTLCTLTSAANSMESYPENHFPSYNPGTSLAEIESSERSKANIILDAIAQDSADFSNWMNKVWGRKI